MEAAKAREGLAMVVAAVAVKVPATAAAAAVAVQLQNLWVVEATALVARATVAAARMLHTRALPRR